MLAVVTGRVGFARFGSAELIAPPLLWPEVRSTLHVARVRNALSPAAADEALDAFEGAPIKERRHRSLGPRAWEIADEFGWSKTYDAEYLALTDLLDAALVTFDLRVQRAGGRLGLLADLDLD